MNFIMPAMRKWFLGVFLVAGCYHPQQIYQFDAPLQAEDPVAVVARTLAAEGQTPAVVDSQLGIVQSQWRNTGFSCLRYTATVARTPSGAQVSLRTDSYFCDQGAACVEGLVQSCRANTIGIAPSEQTQLTALGGKLRQVLTSGPGSAPPAPPAQPSQ